jgi:hypothetical protein
MLNVPSGRDGRSRNEPSEVLIAQIPISRAFLRGRSVDYDLRCLIKELLHPMRAPSAPVIASSLNNTSLIVQLNPFSISKSIIIGTLSTKRINATSSFRVRRQCLPRSSVQPRLPVSEIDFRSGSLVIFGNGIDV